MAIKLAILALKEYYLELTGSAAAVVNAVCDDINLSSRQSQSHNYLNDFEALASAVALRPEAAMLEAAVQEYQYALFAVASGLYRHAFMSLRLTMELALSSILFSAQEIKYRRWASGSADVNWNAIVEEQEGIFSKNFINSFFPDMADSGAQYRAISSATYRECSEYVHGNWKTHQKLGNNVEFKQNLFLAWHDLAESVHLVMVFAFAARFGPFLDPAGLSKVQPVLTDVCGNLAAIQSLYA